MSDIDTRAQDISDVQYHILESVKLKPRRKPLVSRKFLVNRSMTTTNKTGRADSAEGRFNDPGVLLKIGCTLLTEGSFFGRWRFLPEWLWD